MALLTRILGIASWLLNKFLVLCAVGRAEAANLILRNQVKFGTFSLCLGMTVFSTLLRSAVRQIFSSPGGIEVCYCA